MISSEMAKTGFSFKVKEILTKEPGLSVKELAERLETNRQFMSGVLKVLEERGEVVWRQVGPARIYYAANLSKESNHGIK